MAMQDFLYNALNEKLADEKVTIDGEEKKLLDIVVDWEDGFTRTAKVNEDLKHDRETLKGEKSDLTSKLTELETMKNELQQKIDEAKGSTSKRNRETEELQKQINTLSDNLKSVTEQLSDANAKYQAAQTQSREATRNAALESLKTDILTEFGKHKIIGGQASMALSTILAQGNAKVVDGENGTFVRDFSVFKDGKALTADIASLCKHVADENPWLISASGKTGSGRDHTTDGNAVNAGGNSGNYYKMISAGVT